MFFVKVHLEVGISLFMESYGTVALYKVVIYSNNQMHQILQLQTEEFTTFLHHYSSGQS